MKCPACSSSLTAMNINQIEVDVCKGGCGGIWFDQDEIDRFDELSELDAGLLDNIQKDPALKIDRNAARPCPRCAGQVLVRQFFDDKNQVEINQCWKCSGIFLDTGELTAIQKQYKTAAERKKALDNYSKEIISSQVKHMNEVGKQEIEKYREDHATRYRAFVSSIKDLL
jgi:Zn-finger nucleic acid-binding protein